MSNELQRLQEQQQQIERQRTIIEILMKKNERYLHALYRIVLISQEKTSCVDICSCDDVWVEATNALREGA